MKEVIIEAFKYTLILGIAFPLVSKMIFSFCRSFFKYITIAYLTFPGVMLHELSHAIVGWLLGSKIKKVSLFNPQPDGTLGYVEHAPRGTASLMSIQLSLSSVAPAVILPSIAYYLFTYYNPDNLVLFTLKWYLVLCCILHSELSNADCHNYFIGFFRAAFVIVRIVIAFLLTDIWYWRLGICVVLLLPLIISRIKLIFSSN